MGSMFEPGFNYDAYVRQLVATGRYDDERDVMRTALRLLHDADVLHGRHVAEVEGLFAPAIAEVGSGTTIPLNEVRLRLAVQNDREADLRARRKQLEVSFDEALADVRAGKGLTADEVKAHFDRRQEEMLRKRAFVE